MTPITRIHPLSLCVAILVAISAASTSHAAEAEKAAANIYDQSKVPLEVDTTDAKLTKVVLLAGVPSNKSGQHEYFAGCAVLMDLLKQQKAVWPVMARDGWPKNEKIFEGAKVVVYFGDGGGKQPFLEPAKWAILKGLMDRKAGFVLLHQAVDFPQGPETDIQSWLGGIWLRDIGCRGHWDMEFTELAKHPVMNGVKPFAAPGDGWLYNLHFPADMKGVTPLITGAVPDKSRSTPDAKKYAGRQEIIAWAYQRPEGGRGFAFTGADLHKSWGYESQRRMV
ncbi:MAG TPA: hypothetical protein VK968_08535, partial [Roseimicrobium sp.]|nr:hypothetical protein [Roseimicrobium sp.]